MPQEGSIFYQIIAIKLWNSYLGSQLLNNYKFKYVLFSLKISQCY